MWPFRKGIDIPLDLAPQPKATAEPVYCEDCRWYVEDKRFPQYSRCAHPACNERGDGYIARVAASETLKFCSNAREFNCQKAKHFERKPTPAKPAPVDPMMVTLERIAMALEKPQPVQVTVKMPEGEYR